MTGSPCCKPTFLFIILIFSSVIQLRAQYGTIEPSHLLLPEGEHSVEFTWKVDSSQGRFESYAALLLPVRLPGCPKTFYMQFDLGAPSSMFYSGKMEAIRTKYPKAIPVNDSTGLTNFEFFIGKMPVHANRITMRATEEKSIEWEKAGREVIGTIGTDLIDNRVLVLDYPRQTMTLAPEVPARMSPIVMSDFMYVRRSVLLPAKVRGKQTVMFFDTGSSAFELLTSKEICESFPRRDTAVARFEVGSWGRRMTANTYNVSDSISIGNTQFALREATFMVGSTKSQIDQMLNLGIGGMTGNKVFLKSTLVLDTKRKKFGVLTHK